MDAWTERSAELAARRVERRSFLKGAIGLSGLALLDSGRIAKALVNATAPAEANKIGPIVITMMENRSLDHMLGWMGERIDGIQDQWNPKRIQAPSACAPQTASSPFQYGVADPTPVSTYHLQTHCLGSDPDHGWDGSRVEFNGGLMNGFAHRNGLDGMGYYQKADIPFLAWMAEEYTTFSRYHSSVMGPTYPNRVYWLSGQGGGYKGNTIPVPNQADPQADGHDWTSVFHQLDAHGIPWTYYHGDLATVMLFFNRVTANPGKVRFIGDYFADAAAGVLTPIVFLDPSFVVWGNDDHPARDIMWGQRYMYDTFMALAEGPQWYDPTSGKGAAYILTYDEAGGFFDHVPPPRVSDPNAASDHCQDWSRLGFRVPTVVASPFTRRGMVAENLFDHTSILKFVQWRFGMPSIGGDISKKFGAEVNLGSRDIAPEIHNLAEVFDTSTARPEFPSEPPAIPLHALQGLGCAQSQFPEGNGGDNPLEGAPDVPAPPLARPTPPSPPPGLRPHGDWIDLADQGFFGPFDFRERAKDGVLRD